mmetsp:Transcript_22322/g.64326  ORF Transcript_22322/g.64326 Transcript_22322/m.64326 type:complete len:205 (-) Transcript_22322:116-730(-)
MVTYGPCASSPPARPPRCTRRPSSPTPQSIWASRRWTCGRTATAGRLSSTCTRKHAVMARSFWCRRPTGVYSCTTSATSSPRRPPLASRARRFCQAGSTRTPRRSSRPQHRIRWSASWTHVKAARTPAPAVCALGRPSAASVGAPTTRSRSRPLVPPSTPRSRPPTGWPAACWSGICAGPLCRCTSSTAAATPCPTSCGPTPTT